MAEDRPWWRDAVVYQVYVRSFADATGDGTGDINGLRSRLPYLRDLGVDAVWVNPWYKSPLHDGGYDVADYREIEPRYGTIADAEALITDAHAHGIRIIVDMVPNHTSTEHVWFQEAIAAPPGDPSRRRYHILPGKGPDGGAPPTDWGSVFGGSAWERLDDGEWYLHLFDHTQPDLNWDDDEVRDEFDDVLRFWLDRGADGFRVDVAHGLVKDSEYPDAHTGEILSTSKSANHPFWDRDGIHPIVRRWRQVLDGYDGERMMVAEAWVDRERLPLYVRPDEYHQSFNFDFVLAEWELDGLRDVIRQSVDAAAAVGSAPTWVLSNHDVMRHATRYGLPVGTDWRAWLLDGPHDLVDVGVGTRRARAAALMMLALPGSAYLYQGEELGLPEVWDLPAEVLDDPVWEQSGHTMKGRDGCRVPLPWTADGPSYGFGAGPSWLPQPEGFAAFAADLQAGDEDSMLELYRRALAIRRERLVGDEDLELVDAPEGVLAFRRGSGVTCWVNFGMTDVSVPDSAEMLLRSDEDGAITIGPDTAVWFA